jgi:hypothetical protein
MSISIKNRFKALALSFLIMAALSGFSCSQLNSSAKEITMKSLLIEMTDRDRLAKFPDPPYRCMQASSYNRESVSPDLPGWFADSDGIGYIRTEEINGSTEWVLMEDEGPGALTRIWAVCFYYSLQNTVGANIKVYLDGADEPVISTNFFSLVKGQDFIEPPFADSTARAGVLNFPIPYAKSCKVTMDQKAFYNIINYRKYPGGTPVRTFTMEEYRNAAKQRENTARELTSPANLNGNVKEFRQTLGKGKELIIDLPSGSRAVRQLEIRIYNSENIGKLLRSVVLSGEFDNAQTIWVPVGDFFSNVGKIRPYNMFERTVNLDGTMVCRWVMPYKKEGLLRLTNLGDLPADVELKITTGKWKWDENSMHFYATWRMDDPYPTFPLFDWNFLEAEGRGVIVGDEWTVLNPKEGWWGEGDEKIWVDDDFDRNFPSHFGTGTEDYYGWAGGVVPTPLDEFSKPFHGNIIVGDPNSMGYNVCTRTRTLDAIPFSERIKFDVEASCGTRSTWFLLQYAQTTFWYGVPGVTHNRHSLPEMASTPLPSLEALQKKVEKAREKQYVAEGALEAELFALTAKSPDVAENLEDISVWGEISNNAMKNLWFKNEGDFAEFKITEQFEKSVIEMCSTVGPKCGVFDIYVNGILKATQDFCTDHSGMTTPLIQLGENIPVNSAFTIRIVFRGKSPRAKTDREFYALGIDYFLIRNNFMERNKNNQ